MTENETAISPAISMMLDRFEETAETAKNRVLTEEEKQAITASVKDEAALADGLAAIKQASEDYKKSIDSCDEKIKMWQESKKVWKNRSDQFNDVLGFILSKLNVSGLSIKSGGVKLATSKRTSLDVDEEWLIGLYQLQANALQASLPPYIKVTLSLDKTALNNYLKTDNTMLTDNPDKIHFKTKTSTTIK